MPYKKIPNQAWNFPNFRALVLLSRVKWLIPYTPHSEGSCYTRFFLHKRKHNNNLRGGKARVVAISMSLQINAILERTHVNTENCVTLISFKTTQLSNQSRAFPPNQRIRVNQALIESQFYIFLLLWSSYHHPVQSIGGSSSNFITLLPRGNNLNFYFMVVVRQQPLVQCI